MFKWWLSFCEGWAGSLKVKAVRFIYRLSIYIDILWHIIRHIHTYIYIYCIGRVSPGCCLAEDIFSQHNWIHFCAGDWALSLESKVEHLHVHGLRWTWRGKFEVTTSRNESQSQRVSVSHPKCDVLGRIGRRYRRCCCAFQRHSESHSEHVTSRYPHSSSFAFSSFSTCCGL